MLGLALTSVPLGLLRPNRGGRHEKAFTEAHVAPLFAQAMTVSATASSSKRVVVLVNTRNCSAQVTVTGAAGGTVRVVDLAGGALGRGS